MKYSAKHQSIQSSDSLGVVISFLPSFPACSCLSLSFSVLLSPAFHWSFPPSPSFRHGPFPPSVFFPFVPHVSLSLCPSPASLLVTSSSLPLPLSLSQGLPAPSPPPALLTWFTGCLLPPPSRHGPLFLFPPFTVHYPFSSRLTARCPARRPSACRHSFAGVVTALVLDPPRHQGRQTSAHQPLSDALKSSGLVSPPMRPFRRRCCRAAKGGRTCLSEAADC